MILQSSLSLHHGRSLVIRTFATLAPAFLTLQFIAGPTAFAQRDAAATPATYPCVRAAVSSTGITTALGECSALIVDDSPIDHFEADLRHGSFDAHQTDLIPRDFSAIPLVRSYVSRTASLKETALVGSQSLAFGLNTSRFFDGLPVETKTIGHQGAKTVQQVRSSLGSSLLLGYDSRSRIWEADDDRSNTTRYFYGSDGMLCYAFNTSGMIRHYTYDGTLMTAVEDEHRRTLVRNSYTAGHLISQKFANGDVYKFAYTWLAGNVTAGSVVVTLPDHSTKVVSFADQAPSSLSTQ